MGIWFCPPPNICHYLRKIVPKYHRLCKSFVKNLIASGDFDPWTPILKNGARCVAPPPNLAYLRTPLSTKDKVWYTKCTKFKKNVDVLYLLHGINCIMVKLNFWKWIFQPLNGLVPYDISMQLDRQYSEYGQVIWSFVHLYASAPQNLTVLAHVLALVMAAFEIHLVLIVKLIIHFKTFFGLYEIVYASFGPVWNL